MQIFCRVVMSVGAIAVLGQTAMAQTAPTALTVPLSNQTARSPDRLNPAAKPLELPTTPDQVRIQTTQPLTLQQAIDLAQQQSQDIQIANLTLKRSQAALKQAQAARYPTLSSEAEVGYERTTQDQLNDLKYLNEPSTPTGIFSGTVELSYDLFTAGRRPAQIRAAQQQVHVDQLEVARLQAQVRLDITNAYYDVQQAGEEVRIAQSASINNQRSVQDAIALEEGGIGTRIDISRAKVQLSNTEQELIDAQNRQEVARRQLAQLLSLGETVDVSTADPVQRVGEWNRSLEDSIILAYKNRVELQQQAAQRTIAEQQRQAAIASGRPQISLFASYQFLNEFDESFGTLSGYTAGARLRWNLFDGGAARAAASQEEANQAIADTRVVQTRHQIRFQVEQAYKTLQASDRSIQTAAAALKEAQSVLENIQFRFQQGVGTQLDVITAQNDLTRADVNRLRAILSYNRALAALQRAVSN